MKNALAVSVVTPIYNDSKTMKNALIALDGVLKKRRESYEIICIDDGSTDDSSAIAKKCAKKIPQLRLFSHSSNQGIAKTYRALYKKAKGERVVLFSLDGEWDPRDVGKLLQKKEDIVIGCRVEKQYTLWRAFVSYAYNLLMRLLFGVDTRDAGSIKVFRRSVLGLPIISIGVFDEAERLIKAVKNGYSIGYVPILHFKKVKKQRGIKVRHVFEAVKDMVRVFFDVHHL